MKSILRCLAASLILLLFPACDWIQYAFMNSIPFHGDPEKNKDVYVYLAVDGLPYQTVEKARLRGIFGESNWKSSKFITMFPGTSDASWTRILHTENLKGYEYTYYDPTRDEISNKGYSGLIRHVLPTLIDGLSMEAPYVNAFDYRANGYTHMIGVYHDIYSNLAESLDNLFFILDGRAETRDSFSGYLLEIDAMGHIANEEDVISALGLIKRKIDRFKAAHPERRFHFTLVSDHGIDFVRVPMDHLIRLSEEFPRVGIQVVDKLAGHNPNTEIYAIPIDHVRLTYLSIHTHPSLVPEIARRTSTLPFIDLSVGKQRNLNGHGVGVEWFGGWSEGNLVLSFGFNSARNVYLLPRAADYSRFGISPELSRDQEHTEFTDAALFALSKNSPYPDLFYRIRTGLSAVGIDHPGDVLLSFKPGYVAVGFELPWGSKDFAMAGFHGSLRDIGSLGTLLTEERDIPDAVRSDNFLELFPRMKRNMEQKNVRIHSGDPHALLSY